MRYYNSMHKWIDTTLGNEFKIVMGQSPASEYYNDRGQGLPFFQGKKEFGDLYPNIEVWTTQATKKADKGDVLLSVRAPIGDVNIAPKYCGIGRGLAAIKPDDKTCSKFILYLLKAKENELKKRGAGVTFSAITKPNLFSLPIKVPQDKESRDDVVLSIETQLTRLDAAIKSLKTIKAKLELYRKSVLKAAFEPGDSQLVSIEEISSFIGSGITPKGSKQHYRTEGIPFIRSQNIYPFKFVTDGLVYVNSSLHEEMRRTHTIQGDVLLNITGASIGRCAVIPDSLGQANVNQHVCIIRTKENSLPQYLCAYLNSPLGQNQIMAIQGGVTRQGLNYQQIRKLKLPLPSVLKQKKIVDEIESRFSIIDSLGKVIDASLTKAEKLRKSILKSAFEGRLI